MIKSKIVFDDMQKISGFLGKTSDQLQGQTLLITGAGGMLPSYMVESIAWLNQERFSKPCNLICFIRPNSPSSARLDHLQSNTNIKFIEQDINSPLIYDGPADFIIHAASRASPKSYLSAPFDTMDANTLATRQLLELARKRDCQGFLFFSSAEIYGDVPSEHVPTPETYSGATLSTSPRACYTESKRFGETICCTYARTYNLPAVIVRPFHIFGPGMKLDDGRVIADFFHDRLKLNPIRILGGGKSKRAFGYLADATVGFWLALFSKLGGEAFNIGDDRQPVSILELAGLISKLRKPKLSIEVVSDSAPAHLLGSPNTACPDISKARRLLNYEPFTSLDEGLTRLLNWYEELSIQDK